MLVLTINHASIIKIGGDWSLERQYAYIADPKGTFLDNLMAFGSIQNGAGRDDLNVNLNNKSDTSSEIGFSKGGVDHK